MDPLEMPESLDSLTAPELRELHATWVARITELRGQEILTVAEARELRTITAEANTIAAAVNEAAEVTPDLDELAEDPPAEEEAPAELEEAPAEAEAPTEVAPLAHAAGISVADLGGLPSGGAPSENSHPVSQASFRASAGQQVQPAGSTLSLSQLGEIFEDARRTGMASRIMPKTVVASVSRFTEDAPRLSGHNGMTANTDLILNMPQQPQTAAICGPLDVVRTIPDCVDNGRPVRDLFRQIPADRGAFIFQRSVGLGDVGAGNGIWTDADAAALDPNDPTTWKQCLELVCADPITTEVDAIFRCMTADVKQEFSNPEQVQNNLNTLSASADRLAESVLLAKIDALSSAYTFAGDYGSLPALSQLIAALVGKAQSTYRSTEDDPGYVAIMPVGLLNQLTVDTINRGFCCSEDARMVVEASLNAAGLSRWIITPDFSLGGTDPWAGFALNPPGAAPVALPPVTTTWNIQVLDPTDFFYYSTGEIAFGMQRSPELSRRNQIQWFGEIFEGMDKQGCHPSYTIAVDLCPNGDRAGLSTPFTCA